MSERSSSVSSSPIGMLTLFPSMEGSLRWTKTCRSCPFLFSCEPVTRCMSPAAFFLRSNLHCMELLDQSFLLFFLFLFLLLFLLLLALCACAFVLVCVFACVFVGSSELHVPCRWTSARKMCVMMKAPPPLRDVLPSFFQRCCGLSVIPELVSCAKV